MLAEGYSILKASIKNVCVLVVVYHVLKVKKTSLPFLSPPLVPHAPFLQQQGDGCQRHAALLGDGPTCWVFIIWPADPRLQPLPRYLPLSQAPRAFVSVPSCPADLLAKGLAADPASQLH